MDLITAGRLLENVCKKGSWVKIKLVGDGVNVSKDAIGTQVSLPGGNNGNKTLIRQVEVGTGRGNSNDHVLHFGIGQRSESVEATIYWLDGHVQVEEVQANQRSVIVYQ